MPEHYDVEEGQERQVKKMLKKMEKKMTEEVQSINSTLIYVLFLCILYKKH